MDSFCFRFAILDICGKLSNGVKELLQGINTIIFDLGEVIIDLHPNKVINRLSGSWKIPSERIRDIIINSPALIEYETGRIDEEEMLAEIQGKMENKISLPEFEYAWNLMIGDISDQRRKLLSTLRTNYQVLFLSNTNSMHQRRFDQLALERFNLESLSELVDTAHYSHDMGLRKPDSEIYHALLDHHQILPEQCLFFDDRKENVLAASHLGIHSHQVKFPDEILRLL